jgi:hypothetical protein
VAKNVVKKKVGRPAGTGYGKDIISKLHRGFTGALSELDARGKSLDVLLADALERDVNGTIRAMSALLPKADTLDVKVETGDSLSTALAGVSAALKAGKVKGDVIDAEPIEDSVAKLPQSIDNAD